MKVLCTCTYCDYRWQEAYPRHDTVCPKCGDKVIKMKEITAANTINQYKDSPDFEVKEEDKDDDKDPYTPDDWGYSYD